MPQEDPSRIRELEQALAGALLERDAAVAAVDRFHADAEQQSHLLVEEQDRFVQRLIAAHERELTRLRLELDEARANASSSAGRLERERADIDRLEAELTRARQDSLRLREQRDQARLELMRSQQAEQDARAALERLQGDLALARSMLEDAMSLGPTGNSGPPPQSMPRDSGIRGRPPRRSTPPGTTRDRRISQTPAPTGAVSPGDRRPPR